MIKIFCFRHFKIRRRVKNHRICSACFKEFKKRVLDDVTKCDVKVD